MLNLLLSYLGQCVSAPIPLLMWEDYFNEEQFVKIVILYTRLANVLGRQTYEQPLLIAHTNYFRNVMDC